MPSKISVDPASVLPESGGGSGPDITTGADAELTTTIIKLLPERYLKLLPGQVAQAKNLYCLRMSVAKIYIFNRSH